MMDHTYMQKIALQFIVLSYHSLRTRQLSLYTSFITHISTVWA